MIIEVTSARKPHWYKNCIGQQFKVIEKPEWAKRDYPDTGYAVEHEGNSEGELHEIMYENCRVVSDESTAYGTDCRGTCE